MKPAGKYAIALLLILAHVPFIVVCFYAFPFADDFCFGWTAGESISFTQKFLNQYLFWNGRYTADVLVNFHPLVWGGIPSYQTLLVISLAATPVALYLLVRQFISGVGGLLVALFLSLFYLNYQPDITEGLYWFIGIANYHSANLLFVIQLALLVNLLRHPQKLKLFRIVIAGVLLIIAIGCNEVGAVLFPCFYFGMYLHAKQKILLLYLAVAVTASVFVLFSPGNFVRAQQFNHRFDVLHALVYSALQTARFLTDWLLNIPFIIMSGVVIVYMQKIKIQASYRVLAICILLVVFTGSFLPYMATGVLGQHRTINFVYFFFLLFWFLFLLSLPESVGATFKQKIFNRKYTTPVFVLLGIVMMTVSGNSRKIYTDFYAGKFALYKKAFLDRENILLSNPEVAIEKLSNVPATFKIVDVKTDTAYWTDKCMKQYYLKKKR